MLRYEDGELTVTVQAFDCELDVRLFETINVQFGWASLASITDRGYLSCDIFVSVGDERIGQIESHLDVTVALRHE